MPPVPPVPAWIEAWQDAHNNIIILGAALVVLTLILIFQAPLTRRRWLHRWVRNAYLVLVLVWLGWIAGEQLSIVNVINYMLAPFRNYDITFYLAEPLMVMIAAYTAVSLILLGRGVFCGWLCPFGALQELLAQIARALRLPQWNPSEALNRKLWMGKYITAVVILGLAFYSAEAATQVAEVEPFKTAITSHFTRAWPFIVYAVALLAIGLFSERAYCRYLCPLGGALAILDRLHLIDLLKRRPECGSPCHLCERSCPVKAIEPSGKIKMAECFQCLDCQVEYYDDKRCPPLARDRKRRVPSFMEPDAVPAAARTANA
jgi:polyferredoxin